MSPTTKTRPSQRSVKDLLTIASLSAQHISTLIKHARTLQKKRRAGRMPRPLLGKTLGLIFEKPSTRTRVSFEAGMNQLGGQSLFLESEKIQLSRGESLADTAQVLSRYVHGLVVRTFDQATLEEWATHATIPVINGLTDQCHPCQILADLFTIIEKKKRLKGLKLAYVGDGNNVTHSLLEAGALVGMHVSVGCPSGYEPDQKIVEWSMREAAKHHATIDVTPDPIEAVKNADVLYTDVWISMGQEREQKRRLKALSPYQLNERLLNQAKPDAIVMHCLPAHRGEEISTEVLDGPQSVVLEQAENRLDMQNAILIDWLAR
ncbi:MAG: ornithine carbamoyltransferase [Nitrospirales bacterium]|nr:ornithine carbamoyltransferase [Nitrospira sp.]MDR4500793.1 ornithine carbamoyltransferase [Nitrospirales bacterium]